MSLIVVGLNHKTANIDIREKLAIVLSDVASVVEYICKPEDIAACVVVSTCNRTEFYLSCNKPELAIKQFCSWFAVADTEIEKHLYIKTKLECITHLFAVVSGLDSMILGETQILGQVKVSYEISKQSKKLDNLLEPLFQSAFRVAKSVRSNTDIGKNPVSIANSAVTLSQQIFGELAQQKILMIGAGSTAELVLRYVNKHSYQHLSICNRSLHNAEKLAKQFNCSYFELNNLPARIANFDLIFSATSSKTPIIDSNIIKLALKQRQYRPMVIIDIAIPRDVEPNIKKLNDIFYYAVDDLQKVISKNLQSRKQAAIRAKQIITVEAESFLYWLKGQQHTQLIHNFQRETAKIRKHSLDKALKQLKNGTDAEEVLFYLANNLTNKLSHKPVKAIRAAIQSGNAAKIEYIKQLLKLENNLDNTNNDP